MILLDFYCCEGGASAGYSQAGYTVYGVDTFDAFNPKRYPFPYHKGDALATLDTLLAGGGVEFTDGTVLTLPAISAFSASPPCQKYSITNHNKRDYPDLIGSTRERLVASGKPYVIENVVGAPLINPVELCGCMFDLTAVDDDGILLHLHRARRFESNLALTAPRPHDHTGHEWVGGCYDGARHDKYEAKYVRRGGYVPKNKAVVEEYMRINWMSWRGLYQAIPPPYTHHIGLQLLQGENND